MLLIQSFEERVREEDLAADFKKCRDLASAGRSQHGRNVFNERRVVGDIFTGRSITARGKGHEAAVAINRVDCKPVDLQFTEELGWRIESLLNALEPLTQFLLAEDIVQREHSLEVLYRREHRAHLAADRDRWRVC